MQILIPESSDDFARYFELRWRILRAPWGQPQGSEQDALEAASWHRMACLEDRIPIGVARLHLKTPTQAQIRYMAVEPDHRQQGVGTALIAALEHQARGLGTKEILLHARTDALDFYTHRGYVLAGPAHTLFKTIRHYTLIKPLA